MTSSNGKVARPMAVVPAPECATVLKDEPERTALQVCLEQGLTDDDVAERVLTRKAYAAFVNIRIRQLVIREQELEAP